MFFILMFIFVLQTIWLYISELAGKDLDLDIILRFLLYFSPKLIPLVLPLTILVSSIMVFGNFAEKYEFAAMKSTGISLQRAMRSLMVFILILSGTVFYFANEVIPWSEYKSLNLRRNIAQLKPAVAISEGQFNTVGDITIKVGKKSGEQGQLLEDVTIHKKNPNRVGNFTVIKANNGELTSNKGSNTLSLILFDGNYYDEIISKDPKKQEKKPFAKSYFETYTINIDLSEMNAIDLDEEQELSNEKMYRISELKIEIDSLSQNFNQDLQKFPEDIKVRSGITTLETGFQNQESDTIPVKNILDAYTTNAEKKQVLDQSITFVNGAIQSIASRKIIAQNKQKRLNKYEIALHDKYVIAFGCIILFFVGAPLGAIIRKGGMGLPMVIAILIFLTYHFLGIFAKNSAENGKLLPFVGAWLSTIIMLPLGIWLTYRATTDQGIFDLSSVTEPIGNFFKKLFRVKQKNEDIEIVDLKQEIKISPEEQNILNSYETEKLIDIVKNHQQYGYSNDFRIGALKILEDKGISQEELSRTGNLINLKHKKLKLHLAKMKSATNSATVTYVLSLLFPIIISVLEVKSFSLILFNIIIFLTILNFILFHVYLFKIIRNDLIISKIIKDEDSSWNYFIILFGFPLYIAYYFYSKQKIKETLSLLK